MVHEVVSAVPELPVIGIGGILSVDDALEFLTVGASAVQIGTAHYREPDVVPRLLAELPERQREAVVLRHLENLTNPEIATVMDISVEAVESLTARGKRGLARLLAARRQDLGYDE